MLQNYQLLTVFTYHSPWNCGHMEMFTRNSLCYFRIMIVCVTAVIICDL